MNTTNLWALLANGSQAKLIKNPGADQETKETGTENLKGGDIMADRPGRSFSSNGSRRSGMVWHSDPVRQNERLFAEELASDLVRSMDKGRFDSLVVAAAPRTLGDLRSAFPKRLHERVICEVAKDLTNLPDHDVGIAILRLLDKTKAQ